MLLMWLGRLEIIAVFIFLGLVFHEFRLLVVGKEEQPCDPKDEDKVKFDRELTTEAKSASSHRQENKN